jgi:hypothetical protein
MYYLGICLQILRRKKERKKERKEERKTKVQPMLRLKFLLTTTGI